MMVEKASLRATLGEEKEKGVYEFTLIGQGCFTPLVNGEPKTVCIKEEKLLHAIAQKLKGKPLFLNHEITPEKVVGGVIEAWIEEGKVRGKVEILDENILKKVKYVKGLSIDADVILEGDEIKEILEVEGMSLVVSPAFPGAQIHAKKTKYTSKLDPSITSCVADIKWDADEAVDRILKKGGWELLAKTSLVVEVEDGELPEKKSAYSFPLADVVDGKVCWVKKAIASAKAYLNGARGVEIDPEKKKVAEKALEKLEKELEEKLKEVKAMCEKCQELQQELKAKEELILKLQKELEAEKLKAYKVEAINRLPEGVRELAKPAIEIAQTKEDVDKLVAQYSEIAQKIQGTKGIPVIYPPERNHNEEPIAWLVIS